MKYLYTFFFLLCGSCHTCNKVEGITLPKTLLERYNNRENYCLLVEKCLKNQKEYMIKFSTLPIGDAYGYDHGGVLCEIIYKIGEKKYWNAIRNLPSKDKESIKSLLEIGLLYSSNRKFYGKSLKDVYPLLHKNLNSL